MSTTMPEALMRPVGNTEALRSLWGQHPLLTYAHLSLSPRHS